MGQHDEIFMKTLKGVVIFLIVFAIIIYFLAKNLTGGFYNNEGSAATSMDDAAVAERIAPVAKVMEAGARPAGTKPVESKPAGSAAAPTKPVAVAGAAAPTKLSGKDTYTTACFACHGTGAAGAPKLGDKAAWSARIAQGMGVLAEHAIKGFQGSKGFMPAKGGNAALSDTAVTAAVEYMVAESK